jgi:hypothetical protein
MAADDASAFAAREPNDALTLRKVKTDRVLQAALVLMQQL